MIYTSFPYIETIVSKTEIFNVFLQKNLDNISMHGINKKILKNRINKKVFALGEQVYMVGGCLRDLITGQKINDIDYIVRRDAKTFAQNVYDAIGLKGKGTLVHFKKDQVIRIVLKNKITLDFTILKGSLEDNLSERDFTMNSLAWSPDTGLVDLFNGLNDIKKKNIRAVSEKNFVSDPLRLLRAYRFAAELGWGIDRQTKKTLRKLSCHLKKPASERITAEFFKLLNSKNYVSVLKLALRDNILQRFMPISNKQLSENIAELPEIESALKIIPEKTKKNLEQIYSQDLSLNGLLRLEQILYGSKLDRNKLSLSRNILERIKIVHALIKKIKRKNILAKDKLFDTFSKAKDASFDFLILSGRTDLIKEFERFKKIWAGGLLKSKEIMDMTNIRGGAELGRLILKLKKFQFMKRIKTKKQALFLLRLIKKS